VSNTYAAAEWLPAGRHPKTPSTLLDFEHDTKQRNPRGAISLSAALCCSPLQCTRCCSLRVLAVTSSWTLTHAHEAPVPRVPKGASLAVAGCAAVAAAAARHLPLADKLP
jgi:hypothetical protein